MPSYHPLARIRAEMFSVRTPWPLAVGVLVILALLAGCSDHPVGPDSGMAPDAPVFANATSADNKPNFVPNTVQYSNTSKPNATGRAGLATLTARALLGKDGVTLIEATTGELDSSATPPGTIARMMVKGIVDPDEDPLFTKNFNRLGDGGYFSHEFEGLAPGTTAEVQANITGIDRNRTGVITVSETVKMRPDLKAGISAPAQAYENAEIGIQAMVSEINGHMGARAECVLYVEGVEADRASGIWVNAAGTVTCSFVHTFDATGTYGLTVAAEDVTPGDWDTANNSASASIEIISAQQPLHGPTAYASDYAMDYKRAWDYSDPYPNFSNAEWHQESRQEYHVIGNLPSGVTFPVNADLEERSGGAVVASGSGTNLSGDCSIDVLGGGQWLILCYGDHGNWFQYARHASEITYYSANQAEWTGSEIAVYSWNLEAGGPVGVRADWQADVNPRLTLTDANGDVFVADPQIPLTVSSFSSTESDCFFQEIHGTMGFLCSAVEYEQTRKEGWTSF